MRFSLAAGNQAVLDAIPSGASAQVLVKLIDASYTEPGEDEAPAAVCVQVDPRAQMH